MPDGPEGRIAELAGDVPIALLPVRIEARFFDDGRELRVRIYPDQVHIDSHERGLTAAEREAGSAYWRARFEGSASAWPALCAATEPQRGAWIARAMTPTNLEDLGQGAAPRFAPVEEIPQDWSEAARAAALPERWVVIGVRDGGEVFRAWTEPVAETLDVTPAPADEETPPPDGEFPLQDSARWLADFDAAEGAGMAVRIAGVPLSQGLDRLYVLGVDSTRPPDAAAARLRELLEAHVHTDGLSALEPGSPTNVTGKGRSQGPPDRDQLTDALDPERRPARAARAGTGARRTWSALGLDPIDGDILEAVPGAGGRDHEAASHLANALWESTLGLYLTDFMDPVFSDRAIAQVRDHVRQYLFPGGPLAALRIGRQPYGVLPVVAPGRFAPSDGRVDAELADRLGRLRTFWEAAVQAVPRLGRSSDLDADLTALLQTTPMASTMRFREVAGPLTVSATSGLENHARTQERVAGLLGLHLGWPSRPFIAGCAAQGADRRLWVRLVDTPPLEPGEPLSDNYLLEIARLARTSGTYEAIKEREDANSLLEALVAHAVGRELHRADLKVIEEHLIDRGQTDQLPLRVNQTAELVGIEPQATPTAGAAVTTPFEAARIVLEQQSVRQAVTGEVRPGAGGTSVLPELGGVLESLEWLAERPAQELERALRGLLDIYSHRLDPWLTSLATRRLDRVRESVPVGVHLGGYGWLDDLRPDAGAPTSEGYVHAPSVQHAVTAAVLRSGHLAHRGDGEGGALDIDLGSDRVRTALEILDGIREGQQLAELLGYRLERELRERRPPLARHILPLRRLAPLRSDAGEPGGEPTEAIAARDVVDAVALLDRWRTAPEQVLDALRPAPSPADRDGLAGELDALAAVYDAVSDVMVAEAVHQNVAGNNERAGAVLAALDRHERPPSMDFVRTPRTGNALAHRVLVLVGDEDPPAGWELDARAAAEPRLNAWVARLIGDPARVRVAATATGVAEELSASLTDLRLSPLSLVMAARAAGEDQPTELEQRLVVAVAEGLPPDVATPGTEIALLDSPPQGSGDEAVGLAALRALLRRIHGLITQSRPATAIDLSLPQDAGEGDLDDVELGARADALVRSFEAVLDALEEATTAEELRSALWDAAALGVRDSVPPPSPLDGDDQAALAAQASEVTATMRAAVADAATANRAGGTTPQQRVAQHTARVRALLGEGFPVLPRFSASDADALGAALPARARLLDGDELAPSAWLARMALVREGVDRLARARSASELLRGGASPADLAVAQLPLADHERWLALPFPDGRIPEAELAVLIDTPGGEIDFGAPLAGLFCDGWSETVPDREETTGIAFHHDAPGARPPQAILLAVPPALEDPVWSVEAVLDTVSEAHDLARLRAVGPRELPWLGTLLPALYLPRALSTDLPGVDLTRLADKHAEEIAAFETILGRG